MARNTGMNHIVRQEDGTSNAIWGPYRLFSAFQPIFAFHDGKVSIHAFEGLIRTFREGEPVSPGRFFKAVPEQDRMEVETVTRTLHLLNAGACLDPATRLFINFDPSVFTDRAIAEQTLRDMRLTLHEARIDPARIVCEVTEKRAASHEALQSFVDELRRQGFAIAVDDYGADDSDMERIRELKPNIVKFDAAWITKLMESAPGTNLLEAMVSTFREWGITTLFEGIEEHWQLELAERCDVHLVQGFVLARPEIAPTSFGIFSSGVDDRPAIAVTFGADMPDNEINNADATKLAEPEPAVLRKPMPRPQMRSFGRKTSASG